MTIKRLCISIAALMIFALQGVAQNTIEAINEIKLSGKYFTAEATAPNQDEATNQAMGNLIESIGNYCEEMEIEEVGEDMREEFGDTYWWYNIFGRKFINITGNIGHEVQS